jgi:isoleucyl-tRNA synthetase
METMFSDEERYIISKLNSTILAVTDKFEKYHLNEIPGLIEELFLELSRTYVQLVRDKAAVGSENDKEVVLYTIYHVLLETLKLLAPVVPFITEQMYQDMRAAFKLPEESVHLCPWPSADRKKINEKLESSMQTAGKIIETTLAAREKAKISLRWPVMGIHIVSANEDVLKSAEALKPIIKTQVNAKEIHSESSFEEIKEIVKANPGALGKAFAAKAPQIIAKLAEESSQSILNAMSKDKKFTLKVGSEKFDLNPEHIIIERQVPGHIIAMEFKDGIVYLDTTRTPELEAEGFAREIMRHVQSLRKDAGLDKRDQIALVIQADKDFLAMLQPWEAAIKEKVGAKSLKLTDQPLARKHAHSSEQKVKDRKFSIHFDS